MKITEETNVTQSAAPRLKLGDRFGVNCNARDAGSLTANTDSLSVMASLRIHRENATEFWQCIGVYSNVEEDGGLMLQVVIFHPDWEEPLQIAHLRSRPQASSSAVAPLERNLEHKNL